MLPKSNSSKGDSTEMVDVAAIGTRIFTLPREVSNYREWFEKSAEVIVVNRMSRHRKDKFGVLTALMKD